LECVDSSALMEGTMTAAVPLSYAGGGGSRPLLGDGVTSRRDEDEVMEMGHDVALLDVLTQVQHAYKCLLINSNNNNVYPAIHRT